MRDIESLTPAMVAQKLKELGLTPTKVAEMSGIDKAQISNWLSGKRNMSKVASAFFHFFFLEVERTVSV